MNSTTHSERCARHFATAPIPRDAPAILRPWHIRTGHSFACRRELCQTSGPNTRQILPSRHFFLVREDDALPGFVQTFGGPGRHCPPRQRTRRGLARSTRAGAPRVPRQVHSGFRSHFGLGSVILSVLRPPKGLTTRGRLVPFADAHSQGERCTWSSSS